MDSAEDGGVKLDPPDALVDTPIDSAAMISTGPAASTTDPAQRSNSIGALTSWQLLARQVGDGEVEDDNEPPTRKQASAVPEGLLCSPRSASWTSGHSISPRPHHALYKEYRLLETIGKGAFGTVSIAVRRSDGKKLVAKEISQSQAALATAKQREAIMDEVRVLRSSGAESSSPACAMHPAHISLATLRRQAAQDHAGLRPACWLPLLHALCADLSCRSTCWPA
jgi:hypothetical protein